MDKEVYIPTHEFRVVMRAQDVAGQSQTTPKLGCLVTCYDRDDAVVWEMYGNIKKRSPRIDQPTILKYEPKLGLTLSFYLGDLYSINIVSGELNWLKRTNFSDEVYLESHKYNVVLYRDLNNLESHTNPKIEQNVICYDDTGKIVWQLNGDFIQPPSGMINRTITSMYEYNSNLFLRTWSAGVYKVDITTGKLSYHHRSL